MVKSVTPCSGRRRCSLFFCSRQGELIPVLIVDKLLAPDGAAVLHKGSRHAANLADGIADGIDGGAVGRGLTDTLEEGVEAGAGCAAVGGTVPHVADGADIILEVADGVVAVGRLDIRDVAGREGIGNLGCPHLVGNAHT